MPSLICDYRPTAAELEEEYRSLRAAGESLALFWPNAQAGAGTALPDSPAALDAAFEDERLVFFAGPRLPSWLPLDDFDRILLITESSNPKPAETEELFRCGAVEIEILTPEAARELRQSWHSGRRTGGALLRNTG